MLSYSWNMQNQAYSKMHLNDESKHITHHHVLLSFRSVFSVIEVLQFTNDL